MQEMTDEARQHRVAMITLDEYSITALPLAQLCKRKAIGSATGFFYKREDRFFLVSNWHVFSGRDPYTGQSLCKKTAAIPDAIGLPLHTKDQLGHFSEGCVLPLEANGSATLAATPQRSRHRCCCHTRSEYPVRFGSL